jgi:hypothetical protein
MKQRLTAAALVALACLLAVPCFGQYARKNGLTGASILKVGVGARAVALGSAATTFSVTSTSFSGTRLELTSARENPGHFLLQSLDCGPFA